MTSSNIRGQTRLGHLLDQQWHVFVSVLLLEWLVGWLYIKINAKPMIHMSYRLPFLYNHLESIAKQRFY